MIDIRHRLGTILTELRTASAEAAGQWSAEPPPLPDWNVMAKLCSPGP
ncbi:hypothetical protein [Nocardia sp. NPDC057440]